MATDFSSYIPSQLRDTELYTLVMPMISYMMGYGNPDADKMVKRLDDVIYKYKDLNSLQPETLGILLNEFGYGYIENILTLSKGDLANILGFLSLISFYKGSREGYETVLRLLDIDYKITEWWEFFPKQERNTFELDLFLRYYNLITYDQIDLLLDFTRNYVYPIPYTHIYHVLDCPANVGIAPVYIEYITVNPGSVNDVRQYLDVRLDAVTNLIEAITVYPYNNSLTPPTNPTDPGTGSNTSIIPVLSSNTSNFGNVLASSTWNYQGSGNYDHYAPWKAFDQNNNVDDCWISDLSLPAIIGYQFTEGTAEVKSYSIFVSSSRISFAPKSWTFEGSNDGRAPPQERERRA